jgi:hypothetical protein
MGMSVFFASSKKKLLPKIWVGYLFPPPLIENLLGFTVKNGSSSPNQASSQFIFN